MNKQYTMQPSDETESLQNRIVDNVCQKIFDAINNAENISKEKYAVKQKLIESANDMSTQEKLDAIDKNYDRRNYECCQNILYFAVISSSVVGIAIASQVAVKNVRRILSIA